MSCNIKKFSDDTALVGLLTRGNDLACKREVESFVSWCNEHLKKRKTKELVIDFRKKKEVSPVIFAGQQIEIVQSYTVNILGSIWIVN